MSAAPEPKAPAALPPQTNAAPAPPAAPAEEKKAPPPPPPPAPPKPPLTISHEARWREWWGFWVFFVVTTICIVVPFRIGFQIKDWKGWLAPDILTDLTLWADMVIVSLTTFENEGEMVKDRSLIFRRYLKSWLIPDILSVIPLEIIAAGTHEYTPLFRVNRLIRIAQLVLFFMSWEKYTSIKPTYIRIAKSALLIVALAHFIGCIFSLVVIIEGDDATEVFTGVDDMMAYPLYSRYIRSFYWSFVTMTGYNNTSPATQLEAIFCIFVTVMGISLFATIIGTVGSLVTNLDSSKLYFRAKMDGINDYMAYKKIPDELQAEVRNYYNYLWKSGKGLDKNQDLEDLPPYLRNKMSLYLNKEIITKVPMFSKFKDDEAFITEIVKCLKSRVSLPNSFVVRKGEIGTEMYFVSRGELNVVTDDEKVIFTITDGGFFGEIALIYETKRTATIVARTYCDMFILTKDDFMNVKENFPLQVHAIEEEAAERKRANQAKEQEKRNKETAEREAKRLKEEERAAAAAAAAEAAEKRAQEIVERNSNSLKRNDSKSYDRMSNSGTFGGSGSGATTVPTTVIREGSTAAYGATATTPITTIAAHTGVGFGAANSLPPLPHPPAAGGSTLPPLPIIGGSGGMTEAEELAAIREDTSTIVIETNPNAAGDSPVFRRTQAERPASNDTDDTDEEMRLLPPAK